MDENYDINFMQVEFGKVELKAGDIFMIRFSGRISTSEYEHLYKSLREILPADVKIMILEENVQVGVISVQE